jgi:hypothetical protein
VVGSRNHDCVDVAVVEEGAEVALGSRQSPHQRDGLITAPAMHLGDRRHRRAGLVAEVEDVPLADEAETDEAQPHAVVGPHDPGVGSGRQGRDRTASQDRPPAQPGGPLVGRDHRWFLADATGRGPRASAEGPPANLQRRRRPGNPWPGAAVRGIDVDIPVEAAGRRVQRDPREERP